MVSWGPAELNADLVNDFAENSVVLVEEIVAVAGVGVVVGIGAVAAAVAAAAAAAAAAGVVVDGDVAAVKSDARFVV